MDDLISRQAALEIKFSNGMVRRGVAYVRVNELVDELKALPTIQPKPHKGHWIPVTNGRGGHECEICHDYAPSYQSGNEYLANFCPNCGADMRGEQE